MQMILVSVQVRLSVPPSVATLKLKDLSKIQNKQDAACMFGIGSRLCVMT